MHKLILGLLLISLAGCVLNRELFGRYYWIGGGTFGISQDELEKRISSLYTDKALTANASVWAILKARQVKVKYGKDIDFSVMPDKGYGPEKTRRKRFLVYSAKNQTFYRFSFWNFRGISKAHTPCDLLVESVTVLQPDSTLQEIEWQAAGPALATFKQELLPVIRAQAKRAN
jgi:hypothetical protein